ncbi:MAG: glycosyltransferase family 2 protein [Phycisphaerales bacterium]|nr:glycosyltransferase family 2 protein [Phycisphaerales bacterium]
MTVPPLSLVIPLYNEEAVLDELAARLRLALEILPPGTEVVLVDDGSTDRTGERIDQLANRCSGYVAVRLSRNFGHQAAVTAGLQEARGAAVAVLDGDLQDPPELVASMYERLGEGHDVVYAVRRDRKESWPKRVAYAGFYRLFSLLSPLAIPLDAGDFCVMSRRLVDAMNRMPERHRFLRGLRCWVGFSHVGVPYARDARAAGRSKYTIRRLFHLAADGIFTFSDIPLRLASVIGLLVASLAAVWAVVLVIWRLTTNNPLPGFATLAVAVLFLGAVQLISIGILGEYVARIYGEVKGRPTHIVASVRGMGRAASADRRRDPAVSAEDGDGAEIVVRRADAAAAIEVKGAPRGR